MVEYIFFIETIGPAYAEPRARLIEEDGGMPV
jgi:hypothetical protein